MVIAGRRMLMRWRLACERRRMPRVCRALRGISSDAPESSSTKQCTNTAGPAAKRPELDFDYLLDERNRSCIREEISNRKGVGNIDAVFECWDEIKKAAEGKNVPTEAEYRSLWDTLYEETLRIPNRTHPNVPRTGEGRIVDLLNPEARREEKGLQTAEKMVKPWRSLFHPTEASGERSYAFLGPLARLERALLDMAWDRVVGLGFRPVLVSDIVPVDVGAACGITQKSMQYTLDGEKTLALSGTAEMGIAAMLRGLNFPAAELPLRFVAQSRCFRPEISNSATEARLYRVHEFSKVEMFVVCLPEESEAELSNLVDIQKGIVQKLGLFARVLEMPIQELGASAYHKFDIEAWMPGRRVFGEISSASNCTDYQSARMDIRFVESSTGKRRLVHTCNGTAVAVPRMAIALLETLQNEKRKGSIKDLPECLRSYMEQNNSKEKIRFQMGPAFV